MKKSRSVTDDKLKALRDVLVSELVSAVIHGQHPQTVRRLARMVAEADQRLQRHQLARVGLDAPTLERRMQLAGEARMGKIGGV